MNSRGKVTACKKEQLLSLAQGKIKWKKHRSKFMGPEKCKETNLKTLKGDQHIEKE